MKWTAAGWRCIAIFAAAKAEDPREPPICAYIFWLNQKNIVNFALATRREVLHKPGLCIKFLQQLSMGLFDKLKKISSNLSVEKAQGMMDSVNVEGLTEKISSATNSMNEMVESTSEKIESVEADDITSKFSSATNFSFADKIMSALDKDEEDSEEIDNEEADDEETEDETDYEADDEEYDEVDDDDDDDDELKARKKERNKKIAKGFAKGAMFVGSFLYAQKEGADSGSSLLHAFKKTKDVDDFFDGKKKDGKKKEKDQSKDKQIRTIVHYEYICPKNRRGHSVNVPNIDVPTTDGSGCPSRDEAVETIMKVTGVDKAQAHAIWNGGDSLAWHKVSYTYVNNGKPGATVKC